MPYKSLPLLILGLVILLTTVAIEFLPETLYFPVVEYSASGNVQIVLFKNGELERSGCTQVASQLANAILASCPTCKVIERCLRGLDAERSKILARDPLAMPSARLPGGKLTMTISAADPQLALDVCRQTEQQTASKAADQRLRCFPAMAPR